MLYFNSNMVATLHGQSERHCQVNRNPLFFDAKSILARAKNQRLSWHVNQWNLQETS